MTDLDAQLVLGSPYYLEWLEKKKETKVGELIAAYREGKPYSDKAAEISVLEQLKSELKAKQKTVTKKGALNDIANSR